MVDKKLSEFGEVATGNVKYFPILDSDTKNGKLAASRAMPFTNCLTDVPQDIKLELSSGTLTLKSGSVITFPDGSQITPSSDRSMTNNNNGKRFVYINKNSWAMFAGDTLEKTVSGTTDSLAGQTYHTWYDSANSVIKRYTSDGTTPDSAVPSLPLCIVTVSNGAISSIDQVFNGVGYIGNTIFALPGIKGLIPNGRNADGTLKNTAFQNNSLAFYTVNANGEFTIRLRAGYITSGVFPYDPETNYNYNVSIGPGNSRSEVNAGTVIREQSKITKLIVKLPFMSTDYGEFSRADNENAKKGASQVFTGQNQFNGQTKLAGATNVSGNMSSSGTNSFSGPNTFSGSVDLGGNAQVDTPSSLSDDSRKPVTTEWFNDKIQVVAELPSSPNANVFYFITD